MRVDRTALPDFPWDRLEPYKAQAARHPGGIVDLSVGTPVDPTPDIARRALEAASDAPGYPLTHGTPALRAAATDYLRRRFGVIDLDPEAVLPTIGAKELVAWLPTLLGIGPGDVIVIPETAYPTYAVGGQLAGAEVVATDAPDALDESVVERVRLVWLNSPANPTGRIWDAAHLAKIVAWGRERDILVVSDECYLEYAWDAEPVSVLAPEVCGGSPEGLLSVHSLSKRSNLAGYRAGFVTGDRLHVAALLAVR
ncbi:MAG TPA: succinyldiaminopimelate transaminase, partial [Actinopolymorphaceae bacterium]